MSLEPEDTGYTFFPGLLRNYYDDDVGPLLLHLQVQINMQKTYHQTPERETREDFKTFCLCQGLDVAAGFVPEPHRP